MKKYFPNEIEPKWSQRWKEENLFSPNLDLPKNPYYSLMMFPYPSAEGLHVGNMYAFTGSDIFSKYKRMSGFNVFEPIGLDGFGIHSENYALKIGEHPQTLSRRTETRFYEQLTMIGNSYDWTRTVETYKPDYYKWTQWLFLQMFKKGLAYRKKAEVNWCPSCRTVLADEQVISGECERCATPVVKKELEQWFFKITDYTERLLNNLENIDWSEKVKIAQRNWIGKSEGALIKFKVQSAGCKVIEVFTTRPDTLSGVTFLIISPEHPFVASLLKIKNELEEYVKRSKKKGELERKENKEKTGVFTGIYAQHPITGEKIPVWVADYVLTGYGTGAIMGVPASDVRDFEFAKKYGLEVKDVVLSSNRAKESITNYLVRHQLGQKQIQYHLRDWLISRQRYWGPPIPIIYCRRCWEIKDVEGKDYVLIDGKEHLIVPVPEEELPVELPYVENFRPTGTGVSPLAEDADFYKAKCPKCGGEGRRETDVSDTFLDSAWYFFRYTSTEFDDKAFDQERVKKWLPIKMYIGGAEHAVLHLLYARFITMVLFDLGYINFEEPFEKFRAHGLITKEGAKMSKSKGNVVNPDKYIKEWGADTLRMYLIFIGPFSEGGDFRDEAIGGIYRFLTRVFELAQSFKEGEPTKEELKILHQTIKKVGDDIEGLRFNTAVSALMELLNFLTRQKTISKGTIRDFILMLAPFAPFITEELWEMNQLSVLSGQFSDNSQPVISPSVSLRTSPSVSLRTSPSVNKTDKQETGQPDSENRKPKTENWSVHQQSFPKFDSKYLEETEVVVVIQINGKRRDQMIIDNEEAKDQKRIEERALASKKVQKFIEGKEVKKIIYIPGKVINLVIG